MSRPSPFGITSRTILTLCLTCAVLLLFAFFGPVVFQFRDVAPARTMSLWGGVLAAQAGTGTGAFFRTDDGRLLAVFASNTKRPTEETLTRLRRLEEYFGSGTVVRDKWPFVVVKEPLQRIGLAQWEKLVATRPLVDCVIVLENHVKDAMDLDALARLVSDTHLKVGPLLEEGEGEREEPTGPPMAPTLVFSEATMTTLSCRAAHQRSGRSTELAFGDTRERELYLARAVEAAFRTRIIDPSLAGQ